MATVPDVFTYQTATTIAGRKRDLGILGGASTQAWPDELSGRPRSDATIETRLSGIEEQPKVYGSQLLDLGDPRYPLSCPLLVVLESYSDEVVASIPEFDLYASVSLTALECTRHRRPVYSTHGRPMCTRRRRPVCTTCGVRLHSPPIIDLGGAIYGALTYELSS